MYKKTRQSTRHNECAGQATESVVAARRDFHCLVKGQSISSNLFCLLLGQLSISHHTTKPHGAIIGGRACEMRTASVAKTPSVGTGICHFED